jgi:hypothetical protein
MKRNQYGKLATLAGVTILIGYLGFRLEDHHAGSHDHDHSDLYHEHSHLGEGIVSWQDMLPGVHPDRVILNLTETPETSIAINWRTDTTVSAGFVEWAVATAGPEFAEQTSRLEASSERLIVAREGEPILDQTQP